MLCRVLYVIIFCFGLSAHGYEADELLALEVMFPEAEGYSMYLAAPSNPELQRVHVMRMSGSYGIPFNERLVIGFNDEVPYLNNAFIFFTRGAILNDIRVKINEIELVSYDLPTDLVEKYRSRMIDKGPHFFGLRPMGLRRTISRTEPLHAVLSSYQPELVVEMDGHERLKLYESCRSRRAPFNSSKIEGQNLAVLKVLHEELKRLAR